MRKGGGEGREEETGDEEEDRGGGGRRRSRGGPSWGGKGKEEEKEKKERSPELLHQLEGGLPRADGSFGASHAHVGEIMGCLAAGHGAQAGLRR